MQPRTDPDGGASYSASCSTTCNNFSVSCACVADSPLDCFCATGHGAPSCQIGSLASCGDPTTCAADLSSDPANCGRCGHSCEGLTCTGGVCQPLSLNFGGTPQEEIDDWTSDGTFVYGASCGGSVFKMPLGGITDGGAPVLLASGQQCPLGIAIDATNAYWLESGTGTIWTAPLSGTGTPTSLGTCGLTWYSTPLALHGIALDSTSIYFGMSPPSGYGSVFSLPKTGGTPTRLSFDGYLDRATIAVDSTSVYYVTFNDSDGQLRSVPKAGVGDGGASTVLATFTNDQIYGFLLGPSAIYATGQNIYTVPYGGGTPTIFLAGGVFSSPELIATDGVTLFWTDFINGYLYEEPLAGGSANRVVSPGPEPDLILLDATNVYWSSNYGGFMRMPVGYRP